MAYTGDPAADAANGWKTFTAKPRKHHHYSAAQAQSLQREHRVANLAVALRSPEAEELFEQGWQFDCVVKPNARLAPATQAEYEYQELAVNNQWKDSIRLCRAAPRGGKDPRDGEDPEDSWSDGEPAFRDCPCHWVPPRKQ
jgi:hypothetical protein